MMLALRAYIKKFFGIFSKYGGFTGRALNPEPFRNTSFRAPGQSL
jgi:hypothetical protein